MKINLGTGRVVFTDNETGEYYSFNVKDATITYFPDEDVEEGEKIEGKRYYRQVK